MANPYAIFAREILRLEPLPMLGTEPDAALRGSVIHGALSQFTTTFSAALPEDVAGELMRLARAELEEMTGNPRVAAFWLMRLERFARWFGETEARRREGVTRALVEAPGATVIDGPAGPFTLTARADRIDVVAAGAIITDYKTGASLSKLRKDAEEGFAPQLALEAAIVLAGGFAGLTADRIAGLRYISASGGDPAGAEIHLRAKDLPALAAETRRGLERLIASFDDERTPYRAVRRARFAYDYDDYAHLARAGEWSGSEGEEG
jgi:ATP-dependent helicase/nuclease subunit B